MIIRIAGEGQYRMPSGELDRLNELDNQVVALVAAGDHDGFEQGYASMVELIKTKGQPLAVDELVTSDVVLPSSDLSMEEAKTLFVGEGLVPG